MLPLLKGKWPYSHFNYAIGYQLTQHWQPHYKHFLLWPGQRYEMRLCSQAFNVYHWHPPKLSYWELKLKPYLQITCSRNCSGKHVNTGQMERKRFGMNESSRALQMLLQCYHRSAGAEHQCLDREGKRNISTTCICTCANKSVSGFGKQTPFTPFLCKIVTFPIQAMHIQEVLLAGQKNSIF